MSTLPLSIYVKVTHGRADVDRTYGELRDGTYIISEDEQEGHEQLSISRQREPQAEASHAAGRRIAEHEAPGKPPGVH